MKKLFPGVIILFILTAIGCSNDDEGGGDTPAFDRQDMLKGLADHVIMPAYNILDQEVVALDAAIEAFVSTPNAENLAASKEAFVKAYHAWQRTSFWQFGPAFDALLMTSVNSFPTQVNRIDSHIADGTTDASMIANDEKGFPALDYLLFGIADTEAGIVDMYTTEDSAEKRKAYLSLVTQEIKNRVQQVTNGWAASGDNYREVFIDKGGTDVGSSVGLMVNELNKYFERVTRDKKIGIPLGKRSQGIAIPKNVEAFYSGISISLVSENLKAIKDFYMGTGADEQEVSSFYAYLKTLKAQYEGVLLADVIKDNFDIAVKEVGEIPSPYSETVKTNPAPVEEAYQELQKLVILLKADMPSALGVLISYQDNDGD